MSGKTKRPCHGCGRGMAVHRGKRSTCGPACKDQLRLAMKREEQLRAKERGRGRQISGAHPTKYGLTPFIS